MNKSIIGLLLIISLVFTACVPINDIIYLQDKGKSNNESVSKVESKPYRLQTNDILNVTIKAVDPKLVEIFSMNTSQNQQLV